MDKAILKKFAIESRKDLMEKIKNKINTFYINEEFKKEQKGEIYVLSNEKHSLSLTNEEYQKRQLLIKRIKELSLEQVIEEAAYTWFNRIIAIRYMEINDYLPLTKDNQSLGIRVLSSKDNTPDPEILKFTNLINPDLDIDFKKEKYIELKDDNEKFKYVLLLVCKKLGRVIPQVFDGITDYIDILIPDNLLNDTGFITKIINEVPEENYNQVEIIGWLYQYYNQTEKDRVISAKKAYKKNEIPYATQLFTPDWIVKYMVENSLGRYWVEHNGDGTVYPADNLHQSNNLYPSSSITSNWKYFIKENIENKKDDLNPTEITFIDPCCGSGHILVYAFEVFYQIYLKSGFNKNDISELILKNNLYGLDIDDRAGQLSILSVLLKAREYDNNLFNREICHKINIASIAESNNINSDLVINELTEQSSNDCKYLLEKFYDAKEKGALIKLDIKNYTTLKEELKNKNTIFLIDFKEKIKPILKVAEILQEKYTIVVTNPPYMGNSFLSNNMKKFLADEYKEGKSDLCTAFMQIDLLKDNGYYAIINQQVWMFTVLYENLRNWFLNNRNLTTMIHLGTRAFEEISGEVVSTTAFVMDKNINRNKETSFFRFVDIKDARKKENEFITNKNKYKFDLNINKIKLIQGYPFAYWLSDKIFNSFETIKPLNENYECKVGLGTGDNDLYLRHWFEVSEKKKNIKWFPYNKAGGYRKWYGNQMYYFNWENEGKDIKKCSNSYIRNSEYYFREAVSWCDISTGLLSARFYPKGFGFDSCSPSMFPLKDNNLYYVLGFINSKIAQMYMDILSPTIHYNVGSMSKVPLVIKTNKVENIVKESIDLSKSDWDSFEISWDFQKHPLIKEKEKFHYGQIGGTEYKISDCYNHWKDSTEMSFNKLKENEEKLNEIFIDIYGLKDELTPEVEDKDITIRKADKEREIKSLISYAVGCMFGRYSLDKEGLIYAGGDFDEIYKKCKKTDGGWAGVSLANYKVLNDNGQEIDLSFEVDNDNVIPITDEAYFSDDIVERFKTFISVVYGEKTLNENLDFIAETLGKKGTETSEDTIRRYFVNDFFNDHVKTYQKRPIYWLFDSGKKNGFKALVYMHRYNENLIPKVRLDYLHRMQTTYEKLLTDVNDKLTSELSMTDKKEAQRRQADLNAKLQEIREYDEKIAHIANQRISIDLDDGVKVNYDKFKDILAKIK